MVLSRSNICERGNTGSVIFLSNVPCAETTEAVNISLLPIPGLSRGNERVQGVGSFDDGVMDDGVASGTASQRCVVHNPARNPLLIPPIGLQASECSFEELFGEFHVLPDIRL